MAKPKKGPANRKAGTPSPGRKAGAAASKVAPKRPFYVIGHNPNSIELARKFIEGGANAIEPDVNVYEHDESRLCISHGLGGPHAVDVQSYFSALNQIASEEPRLSLVYLDCKPKAATAAHMQTLLAAVREHLTVLDGSDLKVILSVPTIMDAAAAFPNISKALHPNEALMIDEENDPIAVARYFRRLEAANYCYGNGDSVPLLPTEPFFPHVQESIRKACNARGTGVGPRFVVAWTFNTQANQEEFVKDGADGVIVDMPDAILPDGLGNLTRLVARSNRVQLAVREDPFFNP